MLSGCGKTESDRGKLQAEKTESASTTVTSSPVSAVTTANTTTVTTTKKSVTTVSEKTTSESTVKKSSSKKSTSKAADVNAETPVYNHNGQDNNEYQQEENIGERTDLQTQQTQNPNTEKSNQTQKKTTTSKETEKPKPTEAPEPPGLSQADISEINGYIKQTAQSYGIGTECAECNYEGAVILSDADPWNGYSWDTPIAGDFHETVSEYKTGVDSRIKSMHREWTNNGESKEDIAECIYIYVYWEKQSDGTYDLYLMW